MKYSKVRLGFSTFAITGLIAFSAAPVALAHSGDRHDSTVATTTSAESETETDNSTTEVKANETEVENRIEHSRSDGKMKLAELRANKAAKTTEQRQKACEQRKVSISNKLSAYNNAANTKLTQFNTIFERVKKFKTDKALNVSNYDALVTTATEKQAAATDAVAALKDISANFDCTATDPAATLASIKSATSDARAALKDYRKAIKDIVVALAQVNKTTTDSSTTTTTTDTTTTTEAN